MHCFIYRCSAKQDMYIYLAEENNFDVIDATLRSKLGELHFAMPLQLNKNTTLARENPQKVISNLQNRGFHLQLPTTTTIEEFLTARASQK